MKIIKCGGYCTDVIYFPLNLVYAQSYVKGRVVLCGDAMHSIHPIAGQGLNLGLRDVQLIEELIKENIGLGLDICSSNLLNQYSKKREFDVNLMINSTHNINKIFSSNWVPARILRKYGLKVINNFTPLKKYIMSCHHGCREATDGDNDGLIQFGDGSSNNRGKDTRK